MASLAVNHRAVLDKGTYEQNSQLYEIPAAKADYLARLQLLMDTVFDEAELHAEINRMQALILPITGDINSSIDVVRSWVDAHRASVQAEIDSPPAGFGGQPVHYCDCLPIPSPCP